MCNVCGCGQARIADPHSGHDHHDQHEHGHHHAHLHHNHEHDHEHDHDHGSKAEPRTLIVHHHYHHTGDVHHHYHGVATPSHADHAADHRYDHQQGAHQHSHCDESHHHHNDQHDAHQHSHHDEAHHQETGALHYGRGAAGVSVPGMGQRQLIAIEMDVLAKNNQLAAHNREHFQAANQLVLNLVSSPGSGKTTLLCETLRRLSGVRECAVIEGDQQTSADADRIRETGVPAIQINTGKGCHLDAKMVHDACHQLPLTNGGLLFIENVGNLVCPASFDLGEKCKVAILSVTEGEEKPLKYPDMFAAARLMIINKCDLLPYVTFDVARCIENARRINPYIEVIQLSATTGEGMDSWLAWLAKA